ncbi:MAG: hypothetical protein CMG91_00885 [Marinobacter sp.]|nr:hypothetical protein ACP86_10440 [Marinobacter sp. CP1]MAK48042.1 hypothetical protein [Marinobacter sp.]MBI46026.1 hypothetical protein [Marinobacter sp.]HCA12878.1 hypothetical protein [Marinobacter adhaerens]|tara:strand:- start:288 stop:476 length:189 start_codon:yes stop_codon:yes gene_type:complete
MVNNKGFMILIAAEIKYQKVFSKSAPNMKHLSIMFQNQNRMAVSNTDFQRFRGYLILHCKTN